MRARDRDLPPGAGAAFALAAGVVGIYGALDAVPVSLDAAVEAVARVHGEKAGRMVRGLAKVPVGSLVWTRTDDAYFVGRVDGPWRYDDSPAAREVGIHHVRPTTWLDRPFGEHEVPTAVAATFARGGRNFQRIHDDAAARLPRWARFPE